MFFGGPGTENIEVLSGGLETENIDFLVHWGRYGIVGWLRKDHIDVPPRSLFLG